MNQFRQLCKQLEDKIQSSYEAGVTMEEAEKLAGEFLRAQLAVSFELTKADLDSRMRKSGVKAVRAALYINAKSDTSVKHTEGSITALLDSNEIVSGEQTAFDEAEVNKNELDRLYDIFVNAHIFYRGVAKGGFQ